MYKGYILSFLAFFALLCLIMGSPISQGPVASDIDFDMVANTPWHEDDQSPNYNASPLVRRGATFWFVRRRFFTKSCGPWACEEGGFDIISLQDHCGGKGCNMKRLFTWDGEARLCDRKVNVCGTEYELKYTGKEWSCMRLTIFASRGAHHGKTYANLMRNGKRAGMCVVHSEHRYAKTCSAFGATEFWAAVECRID